MPIFLRTLLPITLLVTLTGLVPSVGLAQPAAAIPTSLQVPDGQVLLFRAYADGTTTWTFRQPKAVLVSDDGEPLGIHGRGPFWAGYDGSRVVGSAPVSVPSEHPAHDIPWVLLRGTPGDAEGRFANVSYIQRLDARGGVAPTTPCDPEQQPAVAVPYLAVYHF